MRQQFRFVDDIDPTIVYWIDITHPVKLSPEHGEWLIAEVKRRGVHNFLGATPQLLIEDCSILPAGYPISLDGSARAIVPANGRQTWGEIMEALASGNYDPNSNLPD